MSVLLKDAWKTLQWPLLILSIQNVQIIALFFIMPEIVCIFSFAEQGQMNSYKSWHHAISQKLMWVVIQHLGRKVTSKCIMLLFVNKDPNLTTKKIHESKRLPKHQFSGFNTDAPN